MAGFRPIGRSPVASVEKRESPTGVYSITISTGAVTLSGQPISLRRSLLLTVSTSAITLAGASVNLRRSYPLTVGTRAIALGAASVSLTRQLRLFVASAEISLAGQQVELNVIGNSIPQQQPGGFIRPIKYIGGAKPKPIQEPPSLQISEDELAAYLAQLRAPFEKRETLTALLEAIKDQITDELRQAEMQNLLTQAVYATALDEEENDELLLSA